MIQGWLYNGGTNICAVACSLDWCGGACGGTESAVQYQHGLPVGKDVRPKASDCDGGGDDEEFMCMV